MPFQKIKCDILGDFQTMWYDIKCIAAYKKLLKLEVLIIWNILLRFSDAPHAELRLGRSLNASNIKEGDDVYFECLIHSNPAPSTIVWTRHVSCNFIPFNLSKSRRSASRLLTVLSGLMMNHLFDLLFSTANEWFLGV